MFGLHASKSIRPDYPERVDGKQRQDNGLPGFNSSSLAHQLISLIVTLLVYEDELSADEVSLKAYETPVIHWLHTIYTKLLAGASTGP